MITPYYDRNGIVIYCGNSQEIVKLLDISSVNLVFTDPPYGIEKSSGTINKKRGKGNYQDEFDDSPQYIQTIVVPIIKLLISECRSVVVTPGNKNFCFYPQPDSFGCLYQPAAVGLQTFGNLDSQPIFYYGKNATGKNMGVPCSYQLTERPQNVDHPCPKPLGLWTKMLANLSLPGHLILDPFMGSGTTLLAAQNTNRQAIGIELSEYYCKLAVEQLRQPSLFVMPKALTPKQENLF